MWNFADGFDLYAAPADVANGYWTAYTAGLFTLVAGRFAGSQAVQAASTNNMMFYKSSGVNDAVHHICLAYRQTNALAGTNNYVNIEMYDGGTVQCAIIFRSDGTIFLKSGSAGGGGGTLATYSGAVGVINTWYQFEFEVVINNTTGSFKVRKNGNTVDDSSTTSINTRGGTANNYVNQIMLGVGTTNASQIDDLFWQSGASSGTWLGDIRCYTRMPVSDQSVQFSRSPTTMFAQTTPTASSTSAGFLNRITSTPVVAPATGTLTSLSFNFNAGITGHAKMALYDNTGSAGGPGTLLASSAELTNPGAGVNVFTVAGGPTVTRGTTYYVAIWTDVSTVGLGIAAPTVSWLTLTYTTSFPATLAGFTSSVLAGFGSNGMNLTPFNAGLVNDPQQDAATTYVYDSTPGDADFYGIASIASTPVATIAVTTRGYMQKSDAGTRTAAVQLKSGASTVASPTLVLTTSGWQWAWRTDTVDPNTSAAWTPAAVNNAQVGPKTIA